jgi:hypothetical protein
MAKTQEDNVVLSVALYTIRNSLCILIDSSKSIVQSKRYLIYHSPLPTVNANLPPLCESRVLLRPG